MTKPDIGSVGTLEELQVECGDVVECLLWGDGDACEGTNPHYIRDGKHGVVAYESNDDSASYFSLWSKSIFRLVSRANSVKVCRGDSVGPDVAKVILEVIDDVFSSTSDDKPKTWGEMTDAEKGALLLAAHEGKEIECSVNSFHWGTVNPDWASALYYRVKPEPVRETVTINSWEVATDVLKGHRITFDTIDGVPDCASVEMEEIR